MVYTPCIYMFTIVCTGINMYIHGIDLYIPLCQILSIWSGFQMQAGSASTVAGLTPQDPATVTPASVEVRPG